jgi:hypothetical protein
MPITLLVPLITQVGIPFASQLLALWEKGGVVSSADFQTMISATQVSAKQVVTNALTAAGIAPTDPQYIRILSMVS